MPEPPWNDAYIGAAAAHAQHHASMQSVWGGAITSPVETYADFLTPRMGLQYVSRTWWFHNSHTLRPVLGQ